MAARHPGQLSKQGYCLRSNSFDTECDNVGVIRKQCDTKLNEVIFDLIT